MDRRSFFTVAGLGMLAAAREAQSPVPQAARTPLRFPDVVTPEGLTLTARPASVDTGLGRVEAWTLNGTSPAPTLRIARGASAEIDLVNRLPEPTILHWHGLDVPEAADGHPRLAIPPGATYRYRFEVTDRAGLYWYHPHTHMRTAFQTYAGMAGLIVVTDPEESALGLPSGEDELTVVLADRRLDRSGAPVYAPGMGPDLMMGYFGDTPFGNGVANPTVSVGRRLVRLRLLNGSNARIFELGLSDGTPLTLIGTDGGLLASPARVERVTLASAERVDLLVDLSGHRPGTRLLLQSLPFQIPGAMMGMGMGRGRGMMGGAGVPQGAPMDLLELVVDDGPVERPGALPTRLSTLAAPDIPTDAPRRSFHLTSMMMRHAIDGRAFDLSRVDVRVRAGTTEVWTLINDSELPHPVHVHAGAFRVLARAGGRARVLPWEAGAKDTVLVLPGERVDVAVRFRHPGLFLLHCHNLEHEDAGMMSNFEVIE